MKQALLLLGLLVIVACTQQPKITSFEECVAAGNPVMESYPRQCRADGQMFVEELDAPIDQPDDMADDMPGDIPEDPADEQMFTNDYTACAEERPEMCTMEYNPVCALKDNGVRCVTEPCQSYDAVTMSTGCVACSDSDVMGHYEDSCEQNRFVVCEETMTGFDVEEMAADAGWICVDICPGNYDPYVTQIGATMCIQHYGAEEIEQWEVCEASSESCNCVKAYETTQAEQIEDAQYRCVPDHYAERLLFRGGIDKLDENGDQSVMIA